MQLLTCPSLFAVDECVEAVAVHRFVVSARFGSWWRAPSTESVASVGSGSLAASSRCGFEDCGGPKSRSSRKAAVSAPAVPLPGRMPSSGCSRRAQLYLRFVQRESRSCNHAATFYNSPNWPGHFSRQC